MRSEYQRSSQDTINVNAETHSQFEIIGGYEGVTPVLVPQMTPTLISPERLGSLGTGEPTMAQLMEMNPSEI